MRGLSWLPAATSLGQLKFRKSAAVRRVDSPTGKGTAAGVHFGVSHEFLWLISGELDPQVCGTRVLSLISKRYIIRCII